MSSDYAWAKELALDVQFGYLGRDVVAPRQQHPQVILNGEGASVLRILREELGRCSRFAFSVAFVSPRAIALLKQELVEFDGDGLIVTSDYLGFNSPEAFAELANLQQLGIDVRIHNAPAFHPKGYIFEYPRTMTALVGSSNLTESALVRNHEWNLKVSAAIESDLAAQLSQLINVQLDESAPLTQVWIDEYATSYVRPVSRPRRSPDAGPLTRGVATEDTDAGPPRLMPNLMQLEALEEIAEVRRNGSRRAIVISATGTGKTILSALEVRAARPERLLFVVHREQILDRTIEEYRRVLGGRPEDFGKLTGTVKQPDRKYVFATVQTLSQPQVLTRFSATAFDYIIVDEAHRAGAAGYRRALDHFDPSFLVGMTATPERTDGFNVFELFDYNVPYEIRLNHALEADMLSPFHYYGIADITFEGGRTTTDETDLKVLISPERVDHLLGAIATYAQAGVPPRGLIFCSGKEEARQLADLLRGRLLHGRPLRTIALTGDDSIPYRESIVEQLDRGEVDYILTVDIFNEGIDIPSINQVIMLRQTQSAIVFVQQLGRGLRKAPDKAYLVVIDFIGNYTNNFLIPIALFGDESLNKESLRKNLIAAEEVGVLPGLSSVRFDRISQERVLRSIVDTSLDSMHRLKFAIESMRNRVGGIPALWDFFRFESVDPVVLATKKEHYPALVQSVLREESGLDQSASKALQLLSHEVLPAKRAHEVVLLELLLHQNVVTLADIERAFTEADLPASKRHIDSTVDTFTLAEHSEVDQKRYARGVVERAANGFALTPDFAASYQDSARFAAAVDDIVRTGRSLVEHGYDKATPFTRGRQYSRKEVTRLLCWPRKWTSTLYGYRTDTVTAVCPIFVTLHKSDEVTASTRYEDKLIDETTMQWSTRSRRTLGSDEIRPIVDGHVALYVFVKKDDAEGTAFYFLGQAEAHDPIETTIPDDQGRPLDVVLMTLRFAEPIETALFDYFHPTVTMDLSNDLTSPASAST